MGEIIVGIVTGIISSIIVSKLYRMLEGDRENRFKFEHDKQMLSKYITLIRAELKLYSETNNKENLLRALNEPRLYYSFIEENLSKESLESIAEANNLFNELRNRLDNNNISNTEKYSINLFKAQLNILKIKMQEENRINRRILFWILK